MANPKDSAATRAIPSAGPDFEHLLAQEVVIEAGDAAPTGAQAIAPDHSPRAPTGDAQRVDSLSRLRERAGVRATPELQQEIEQFLYLQAEFLDGKHWQAFIDLFDDQGVYWMPVTREQTEWEGSPSIFAEDKLMMEIRKGRVSHPNAWSQAPMWETNHATAPAPCASACSASTFSIRRRRSTTCCRSGSDDSGVRSPSDDGRRLPTRWRPSPG